MFLAAASKDCVSHTRIHENKQTWKSTSYAHTHDGHQRRKKIVESRLRQLSQAIQMWNNVWKPWCFPTRGTSHLNCPRSFWNRMRFRHHLLYEFYPALFKFCIIVWHPMTSKAVTQVVQRDEFSQLCLGSLASKIRIGTIVWHLSHGICSCDCSMGLLHLTSLSGDRSFGIFDLGIWVWEPPPGISRVETLGGELSSGNYFVEPSRGTLAFRVLTPLR